MNNIIRQQLRSFSTRIQRRLDRENKKREDTGPVMQGAGARYEISERVRAVGAGGVGVIDEMVKAIGLPNLIDSRVQLLKTHQPYHESDHIASIAYNVLAGGEHLQNLELRRYDENYLDMLGARRLPGPSTVGDFCRRFESKENVDALQESINEARLRVWSTQPEDFFDHALIDADGSMVEASPCTKDADFSYKRTFGFQPLLVTLANTQEVLFLDNRAASRPSHEGAAARLDQSVDLVRRAGFKKITLRGDTDFSQTEYLDGWNDQGVNFVFGYAAYKGVERKAEQIDDEDWELLERGDRYQIKTLPRARPTNTREEEVREQEYLNIHLAEEHVSEFKHCPNKCGRTYRMVVVRKLVTHERGQALLFQQTRYLFYITNRWDVSAREVVRLANNRCDQERVIGQLKSDVKSLRCPLDNLHSNWAYMVSATLAWNLSRWFALLLPEGGRWKERRREEKTKVLRMNFGTFLSSFMLVPTQVVRAARRVAREPRRQR